MKLNQPKIPIDRLESRCHLADLKILLIPCIGCVSVSTTDRLEVSRTSDGRPSLAFHVKRREAPQEKVKARRKDEKYTGSTQVRSLEKEDDEKQHPGEVNTRECHSIHNA